MATEILNSQLDGARYVLTSVVSCIRASTDQSRIDVSLSCADGPDGVEVTFFSTSLFAFDNMVELTDVGLLVEEYFRVNNKISGSVCIRFDDVSVTTHFLYCEYAMPAAFDPTKTFFISAMTQRVHQDSVITIATADRGAGHPFLFKVVGHAAADDRLAVYEKSVTQPFGEGGAVRFAVADIIGWALGDAGAPLRDVLYFSIEYCGIQKMCYLVPAPAYLTFIFRNAFNVPEYLDVVGLMTTKTEVSREVAVCKGVSRQYDRNVERTYKVRTEPLTTDEVRAFEQFLASYRVALCLDGDTRDVIVTEHTCEPDSDDDSLTVVEFTWRFADRRPRVFESLMDGVMPTRRRIFDDTFSPEYE